MKLKEIIDQADQQLFNNFPSTLYKNDPNYIRPLDKDINAVFNPSDNQLFSIGQCIRWILLDQDEKIIGRIAAFYDQSSVDQYDIAAGGCGFFECINDQNAANFLFDAAKIWLLSHGIEAMDGPINFGSRERWWGLLVEGFYPPCYGANYQHPYYKELFENYGFKLYFKQYTYRIDFRKGLDQQYAAKVARIVGNQGYSIDHIHKHNLKHAATYFREVYNKAWVHHAGVGAMSAAQSERLLKTLRPILDITGLWFVFYQDQPVAFFIAIPDVNEMMVKYANGKPGLKAIAMLFYKKWFKKCSTLFGIVFGVVPEHQRKGVEGALVLALGNFFHFRSHETGYDSFQMNWVGDFNPRMVNLAQKMGGEMYKIHHTYRYLFDREKSFERYPII